MIFDLLLKFRIFSLIQLSFGGFFFLVVFNYVSVYKLHVHNFEFKSTHGPPEMANNSTVCEKEYFHGLTSCIKSMDFLN